MLDSLLLLVFFFFKQKTAYEMRISDWSSDVCSSDLVTSHFSFLRGASAPEELFASAALLGHSALGLCDRGSVAGMVRGLSGQEATGEIGRASCRDRVCQSV